MCGRLVVVVPDLSVFVLPFGVKRHAAGVWQPRFNLAPTQLAPVVTNEPERRLDLFRFGLVPAWAAAAHKPKQLINARVETVASRRSFREALAVRRCVIPVSGYYEWQTRGGRKQPLFIHAADGGTLPLAGVWERWQAHDGTSLEGFAVLTRASVGFLQDIHERMPLALPWEHVERWLDPNELSPEALEPILHALPDLEHWSAREVAPLVNSAQYDAPDCLTAYSAAALPPDRQLELFASPAALPRTLPSAK
jgi:putative SOS response-associated peptidase YedK